MHEDEEDAGADGDAGEDLWHPRDIRGGRPREPEEAGGEQSGADDHGRKPLFRHDFAVFLQFPGEARLGDPGDDDDADEDADGDAEEGEGADAVVPAALLLEGDGEGFEEEVGDAVDEGEVDGDEDEDGFEDEHGEGAEEVFDDDFVGVDAGFVGVGVEGPVFGFVAQFSGASLEEDGRVGFRDEDQSEGAEEKHHDHRYPRRPPPAEVTLRDEAAHDGPGDGADEGGGGEDSDGDATVDGVPEVGEGAADDGDGGAAEGTAEEAGEHDGFDVLGGGDGDLEDAEDEEAEEEGGSAAVELGEGAPEEGAECEALGG